ncbi:MAG: ChbG/HpnK family deacetylase [Candidatus Fermentibacteraceae bacterium]|nr:ChbG/HpnK family deacetylase [Candidatus Fermentibacteraceae bacterium]
MRIKVTIDDLGLSSLVNRAVKILLNAGLVDSLSILVTGAALDEALEIAGTPGVKIAVHLNCSEPPFLTGVKFPDSFYTWFRNGSLLAGKVKDEWRLQIERVLAAGVMITGLDSHHHLHNLSGLREVILDLAKEYGIGTVRAAVLPDKLRRPSGIVLDNLGRKLVKMAGKRGIGTPDLMLGFSKSGNVTRKYLDSLSRSLRCEGLAELVMHPAISPVWTSTQPDELELMRSEWFKEWLKLS